MFCNWRCCMTLQVVSWWGPTWRAGSHDTQGVNTDAVLGLVLAEAAQQQQLKVAIHMEPYEGETAPALEKEATAVVAAMVTAAECYLAVHPVWF
jgi:glycoprotein endo-alpha-1,2-mannosidase